MAKEICFECGGYGKEGDGCPKCGKKSRNSLDVVQMKNPKAFIKKCQWNLIPEEYIGVEWDKHCLLVYHEKYEHDVNFKRFLEQCEKFQSIFKNGKLVNKSVLFYAPPSFGKDFLAFSCMQLASNAGLKVAPFLDTADVKRLLILSAERPDYKVLGRIDYDEYITSDVVFVSVTKTRYVAEAYETLLELLSKRSRLGLPTYILSEYSLEDLSNSNPNKFNRNKFINVSIHVNELKYPAVIGFNTID